MDPMTDVDVDRRTMLRSAGAVAVAGMLAGCGGGGGDDEEPEDTTEDEETTEGDDETTEEDGHDDDHSVPDEVANYLSDANNYDGSVMDMTGQDAVSIDVGAASGFAFGPAAVRISTGTTVTWEWTGQGGAHNVVAEDGEFNSGETVETGTFEHTFDSAGNFTYYCDPHRGAGMLGAVIVEM